LSSAYRAIAIASPPIAALIVLVAGAITPGYDPATITISRLAVPGMPAAAAVDAAILLVALACFSLAALLAPTARECRFALAVAGLAFAVTALVHMDLASHGATAIHRVASGIGVVGLTAAPFLLAGRYRRVSLAVGLAEVGMLLTAPALIAMSFDAWGAWQRGLFAIALSWIVLIAATRPSTEEIASASAATLSSSGS